MLDIDSSSSSLSLASSLPIYSIEGASSFIRLSIKLEVLRLILLGRGERELNLLYRGL